MAETPTLKLKKIVTKKPVKVTVPLPHDLNEDLEIYAKIYEKAHGEEQSVNSLIPYMLSAFIASDSGFKKAKRELA